MTPLITEHSIMAAEAHAIAEGVLERARLEKTKLFHQTLEAAYLSIRKFANNGGFEVGISVPHIIADMAEELMAEFSSRNYGVKAESEEDLIKLIISW